MIALMTLLLNCFTRTLLVIREVSGRVTANIDHRYRGNLAGPETGLAGAVEVVRNLYSESCLYLMCLETLVDVLLEC